MLRFESIASPSRSYVWPLIFELVVDDSIHFLSALVSGVRTNTMHQHPTGQVPVPIPPANLTALMEPSPRVPIQQPNFTKDGTHAAGDATHTHAPSDGAHVPYTSNLTVPAKSLRLTLAAQTTIGIGCMRFEMPPGGADLSVQCSFFDNILHSEDAIRSHTCLLEALAFMYLQPTCVCLQPTCV